MSKEALNPGIDTCEVFCYDEEKVNRIKNRVDEVSGVELLFKALADSTRIKIAYALTIEKELCVCDVANIIGCNNSHSFASFAIIKKYGVG